MKLSIPTIKLLCSLWNYVEQILEDKEYLQHTLNYLENYNYSYPLSEQEREKAKEEIEKLIKNKDMTTFELKPTNGRKSFYGKCKVEQEDNISYLISYNTKVAHYNHLTNTMTVNGYYSPTTATHINAFLSYYGFDTCNKKELENYNN